MESNWWVMYGLLIVVCVLKGSFGLRLTNLEVPRHANVGSTVRLGCHFELDKNLYSVKWYKDDYEFYRYMPDNNPKSQIFPVSGIHLDNSLSDMNFVALDNVEYKTTGTYKCEVSTEGPAFDTIFRSKNMTVLSFPDRGPVISGAQQTYSEGDFITVNCTSGRSNPEPVLSWYINGMKADTYLLDTSSPKMAHASPDRMGLLYSRSLGMRTRVEKSHFQGSDSTIKLKCMSTVADMVPLTASVEPHLASSSSNQKLAQEIPPINKGAWPKTSSLLFLAIHLRLVLHT